MSLTRLVLKYAAPVPQLCEYDTYLFVGPHPDDIEIGAGATVSKLVSLGKKVVFLICTDGRYGKDYTELSGEELIETRRKEAMLSASVLGVRDVRFLNLSDGGFYEFKDMLEGIAKVMGDVQPDVIFAPDPCVDSECHPDHLNTGNAVRRLACVAANPGIMGQYGAKTVALKALAYYMTARPNRYVCVNGHLAKQRKAIFECHLSQFPQTGGPGDSIVLYLKLRAAEFGMRSFKGQAEGFRVLGPVHMHCLPEAGGK